MSEGHSSSHYRGLFLKVTTNVLTEPVPLFRTLHGHLFGLLSPIQQVPIPALKTSSCVYCIIIYASYTHLLSFQVSHYCGLCDRFFFILSFCLQYFCYCLMCSWDLNLLTVVVDINCELHRTQNHLLYKYLRVSLRELPHCFNWGERTLLNMSGIRQWMGS